MNIKWSAPHLHSFCTRCQSCFAGTQVLQVILRTWTATNNAGLSTNVIQTITVKDTTPPTLTIVPTMRLVDVGGSWSFGQPIASDTCGAVNVSVLNTLTN